MLTHAQRDLFVLICSEMTRGHKPTFGEMADRLGMSKGNIHRLIAGLTMRGFIAPRRRFSRMSTLDILRPYPLIPIYDAETNKVRGFIA